MFILIRYKIHYLAVKAVNYTGQSLRFKLVQKVTFLNQKNNLTSNLSHESGYTNMVYVFESLKRTKS